MRLRDYHTLWYGFPANFDFPGRTFNIWTKTPHLLCLSTKDSVCPVLFSLAVTNSIPIGFFSCRYLNVLIPCVPDPYGSNAEVAFGYLRFKAYVRLPGAYRSLSRPSSALEPSHPPNSSDFIAFVLQA